MVEEKDNCTFLCKHTLSSHQNKYVCNRTAAADAFSAGSGSRHTLACSHAAQLVPCGSLSHDDIVISAAANIRHHAFLLTGPEMQRTFLKRATAGGTLAAPSLRHGGTFYSRQRSNSGIFSSAFFYFFISLVPFSTLGPGCFFSFSLPRFGFSVR